MPVLSPHRSSASPLAGSYRSTFSSALDRQYFNSSPTYNNHPRISSFSERYTSRSYPDGRRVFSRSGSITEDGITTRYREETRENSIGRRGDSISRDSGIGSIRENSIISDYQPIRRDNSITRDRLSAINVLDSVAELRNKYSPANYVPACMRNRDVITNNGTSSITTTHGGPSSSSSLLNNKSNNDHIISRSKSINDIGLPPIEKLTTTTTTQPSQTTTSTTNKKKVKADLKNCNNGLVVVCYNNSNNTNHHDDNNGLITEDDNGNRASVADLRKKFDITSQSSSSSSNERKKPLDEDDLIVRGTRVNNFASYIPTKDYQQQQQKLLKNEEIVNGIVEGDGLKVDAAKKYQNNISTSPKLNNSGSGGTTTTIKSPSNSLQRKSQDRERFIHNNIDDSDDDDGIYNNSTGSSSDKYKITTPTTTLIIPKTKQTKILGLNGLKNIGNTCFMNSVIQCLSNTKLLLEYLRKDAYIHDINTTISGMKGALIKAFAEVIKELWSEDSIDRVVNTVSLKSQIQRFAPRFIGYAQQDAQEFLRYLLEGLHEDVNRVTEKPKPILTEIDEKLSDKEKAAESWSRYLRMDNSRIVDYFVGQLKSTLKCTHCGHCSVTFDPFWDLSLPIPQRTGQVRLSQCLDSFTREETLDGDEKPTCSKCKERRKCTKSFKIQKFPQILVLHLKRFSPTERFRGKLNVIVDFPLEGLDVNQYAADSVSSPKYNLYAVSNHSGTTYSGHYTASCRHPYAGIWHEYNDSRVSPISPKSVVSAEAYVLFYEQEGQKSHL